MNSEQFTSLPHSGGVGTGNGNSNRNYFNGNRNYKKKGRRNNYKNNNNNNNNNNTNNVNVNNQQQHNSYHNQHSDFGCSSLPHTQTNYNNNRYNNQYQQFNKFTSNLPDLDSFGNNVPVPKSVKKNNKPRRGGNNNTYRSAGQFSNANGSERLNKSLNKDDVSFSDMNSMMPTSYSLDNIGAINNVSKSTSFHNNLPLKLNKLTEEISEIPNIDSGVDSNSYCSMPTDGQKSYTPLTSDLLSSIEADEFEEPASKTSSSVSSPSTNSPNQNGYETAISQMASEAENSFGAFDSINPNNENTIIDVEIEALSYVNQIEQAVLEQYIHETNVIENIDQAVSVSANAETVVENLGDTTTSVSSDSFENDFVKEDPVKLLVENVEKLSITVKEVEPILEVEEVKEEPMVETVQEETNLMSSSSFQEEISLSKADMKLLAQIKFAEQEVNDLVNKIVHDVITQAITVAPLPDFVEADIHNHMSLEQEINQVEEAQVKEESRCIDDLEISYIDNDNSVISGKEETDVASQSMEVIKGPEEPDVDTTDDILSKTEEILSNSPAKNVIKNNIAVKEPPVDCFSCTIS